jgi:probable rRNA maturation factor
VVRVVEEVLRRERATATISVTFFGREPMRRLHAIHKGQDRPTDVLAFGLATPDGGTVGDVYVCRAVAARHAVRHGVPLRQELIRLIIHGTLHVLGWDHPEDDSRTRSPMWRRQERYVRALA